MNDLFASPISVTTVFLTHFEGADLYALEHKHTGAFTGHFGRVAPMGERILFNINSMLCARESLPKWVRLADDLYSEYLDSRFWDEVVS
jgi:hypothetical protein